MYLRRTAALSLFLFGCALGASAQTISIVPVATAQVEDRIFTTTLALRNDGKQEASCTVIYALPHDPRGGTLRGRYTLPPGGAPQVELNAFSEGAAVGSLQIGCSAKVVIAARIQASTDGGATFDSGRTYAALDEASAFRRSRSVAADGDLFIAEVAGKPVTFEAIVTNKSGGVIARRTYALEAFGLQIVNLSELPSAAAIRPAAVKIVLASGGGALVAGKQTRDPDLLQLVARRDRTFTLAADAVSAAVAVASASRSIPQFGTASFQAAPFHDSFTGLVYFRNRWYDPRTGSWLTPDPMGYTDSANPYAFAGGDPVNGRDPSGLCLGLDKAGKPCSEYARMLPGLVVEGLGLDRIPRTGSTRADAGIRRIAEAPARLAALPAAALLATGESTGEVAHRMERSTFNGEQAFDATVDDALLIAGAMGDVATMASPLATLERGSIVPRRRQLANTNKRHALTSHEKGILGTQWSRESVLRRGGQVVGEEVDLIFKIAGRDVGVRADILSLEGIDYVYIESKFTPRASFTRNQRIVVPELVRAGDAGLVGEIGPRSGALNAGDKVRVVFQGDV